VPALRAPHTQRLPTTQNETPGNAPAFLPFLREANMSDLQCSPPVLNALMSVFSAGMRIGAPAELDDMLIMLRTWQPHSPLADVCQARLLINHSQWREASQLLRHVTDHHAGLPIVTALNALCLFMLQDDEWRRCASDVVTLGNETALAVVARFLNVTDGDVSSEDLAARVTAATQSTQPVEAY
jgi:type III secretion protein HrpB1